jgi:hypothetical protein
VALSGGSNVLSLTSVIEPSAGAERTKEKRSGVHELWNSDEYRSVWWTVPLDSLGAARGKGFESAVGVAATWEVPAGFNVLNVLVAVPPGVPPANRLIFAIYADGRPITRSAPLSSSDKPTPLRAPLGPVRSISLRVEAGFPTTATGSGLWLDPVLIRK